MKKEIYDISIPTIEDDRRNTHSDMGLIGNDLKKGVRSKSWGVTKKKIHLD
jgi:hypothetical protein